MLLGGALSPAICRAAHASRHGEIDRVVGLAVVVDVDVDSLFAGASVNGELSACSIALLAAAVASPRAVQVTDRLQVGAARRECAGDHHCR